MWITISHMRYFRLTTFTLCLALPAFAALAQFQPVEPETVPELPLERDGPMQDMPKPQQAPVIEQQAEVDVESDAVEGIDKMLVELKRDRDPESAQALAKRIFTRWADSDSATVNLLMKWAVEAIQENRNAAALDFLNQAIVLKPDFAGSWNRRATLHYTMGEYRKSMEDINQVLAIEPRHFGALAGMAAILVETDRDEMALRAWQRYLEIYPADRDAQNVVTKLSEKLAGNRT